MQLLLVQRAAGGLTIGDTHVYDEPFDFAVEEHLYDELRARAESVLGWPTAPGRAALGRCLHRASTDDRLYYRAQPRARGRGRDRAGRAGHDPVAGHRRGDLGGSDPMTPPIRLAALDMAGTTVADEGAVEEAFQSALDAVGLVAGDLMDDPGAYIRRTMGQSKITVFTELLGGDRHRAEQANAAFEAAFDQAVDRGEVAALPGLRGGLRRPACRRCPDLPDHRVLARHPRPASSTRSTGRAGSTSPSPRSTPAGVGPWPDMILTAVLPPPDRRRRRGGRGRRHHVRPPGRHPVRRLESWPGC